MKFNFRINNKPFEVDLLDIHSQPITAIVNGEIIDVWVEDENRYNNNNNTQTVAEIPSELIFPKQEIPSPPGAVTTPKKSIQSPIPGVVISVDVRAGDRVQHGQELCVIEAMKMKNMIRSPRTGAIKLVNVRVGQAVQYRDVLFEYSE
jgi:biotin carboxyl carrier protein